jgi:hypothetical protein
VALSSRLAGRLFTNAYRAADRVSQYLIRNVIYQSDLPGNADELVFRILLFKLFNRPTAKPTGRSPKRSGRSANSPTCSPGPRSWRPAITGPTAGHGESAVSEKHPAESAPRPRE